MPSTRFLLRSALAAGTALGLTLAVQAKPIPPGPGVISNNVDRPDHPEDPAIQGLASMVMPTTATPKDKLPLDKLHAPDGFKIEVYASGIANVREMQIAPDGTVFAGSRIAGRVYAVTPDTHQVKVIAKGLHVPNGVALKDGTLYISEISPSHEDPGRSQPSRQPARAGTRL